MRSELEQAIEEMRTRTETASWHLPVAEAVQGEIDAIRTRTANARGGTAQERLGYCLDTVREAHQVPDRTMERAMDPDSFPEDGKMHAHPGRFRPVPRIPQPGAVPRGRSGRRRVRRRPHPHHHAGSARRGRRVGRSEAHPLRPGNHEYDNTDIDQARTFLARECDRRGITLLDPGATIIDDVHFIGATPWTDFLLDGMAREPGAHRIAGLRIADFNETITYENRTKGFTTCESARRHAEDRAFIEAELADAQREGTTAVVITHHAPTPRSIATRFHGNPLNRAFASDLESVIARYEPALWIHGHMHNKVDVTLGATRVLANPGGYNAEENPDYDPQLCVELGAG